MCVVCRPESIPHLSQQTSNSGSSSTPGSGSISGGPSLHPTLSQGQSGSPVKESSILQRGMSVDEQDGEEIGEEVGKSFSLAGVGVGVGRGSGRGFPFGSRRGRLEVGVWRKLGGEMRYESD